MAASRCCPTSKLRRRAATTTVVERDAAALPMHQKTSDQPCETCRMEGVTVRLILRRAAKDPRRAAKGWRSGQSRDGMPPRGRYARAVLLPA